MDDKKTKAINLLEEVLQNLENPKISLSSIIQKLNRAGKLLEEKKLVGWTEIQLGNISYTGILSELVEDFIENSKKNTAATKKKLGETKKKAEDAQLLQLVSNDELTAKANVSGGGFSNIGFIEQRYLDLAKSKKGNDGTYYLSNLTNTLSVVRSITYKKASFYHSKYAFSGLPESNFDLLKKFVDDKLLDLDPELGEQLMLAFKNSSSENKEEWSQALTSCRRFFEKLADSLYPASELKLNGRSLAKENYINRIWAYLDSKISSASNKELAKKHIDYIGSYFQSIYKITNKGVHSELDRIEALKTVMHIYLVCVDILSFVEINLETKNRITIYSASIDELEAIGGISRKIAKEIIKLRVNNKNIAKSDLLKISGFGPKTLSNFLENVSLSE